ncbi:MAG: sulfite exporter TauE/SafE family protein, partial [Planctomycetes bacterium]|nr:sulfite exporter TauE/SafE family protein [Planctomycetota bacterium]
MTWLEQTVEQLVASGSPLAYLFVLLGGILTSFTPCIYPILPIIVGYIGAQQVQSRFQAFLLSFIYVLGMSVTFAILGALATVPGYMFGDIQQSPYASLAIGNIILLMALWFLGIINIPLPAIKTPKIIRKGFLASFLLGLTSGIIAAPCAAAIMVVLFIAIAQSDINVIFGASLFFTYGLGLGALIIIAGTFTGFIKTLMKSEKISLVVKKVFG